MNLNEEIKQFRAEQIKIHDQLDSQEDPEIKKTFDACIASLKATVASNPYVTNFHLFMKDENRFYLFSKLFNKEGFKVQVNYPGHLTITIE